MFKSLTFDNVNSLDYGVHINGEGVYNAPERDVEMIAIPGRNGEYALDHGRFNNIEVTYPAGIGEMSQADFADKISAFRNALASRRGYYRLEDGYHPDEFRMGVYKSGLEASPVMYNRAGEFDLVFNCKPQRFLKSGEQRTEFTQDGTINNPTLFESKPLLELYGYGTLNVNGSQIELNNDPMGEVVLINEIRENTSLEVYSTSVSFPPEMMYSGDPITVTNPFLAFDASSSRGAFNITSVSSGTATNATIKTETNSTDGLTARFDDFSFTAGTTKTITYSRSCQYGIGTSPLYIQTGTWTVDFEITYDGQQTFGILLSQTFATSAPRSYAKPLASRLWTDDVTADSTMSSLGNPLYLDCEIGEAYKEVNGQIVLVNRNVEIPSDLPALSPGANTITIANTFTKVNVIPRWWII